MSKSTFLKELTILYVEDEQDVMEEISDILNIKIGKLITASNGQEALDIFNNEENHIDMIITDIQMPVMDGLELIENIRKFNEDIPIIITTAFNEIEFLKKAIDLHVDKYITKPIDIVQLLNVTQRASIVIEQRKQINQRDLIIQTVLDMKPYYSIIVDKNNISKLKEELLSKLNFKQEDIINVKFQTQTEYCGKTNSIEKLFENILLLETDPKSIETVCLENKTQNSEKYILKPFFFTGTDLLMLSFFENDRIDKHSELEKCYECMGDAYQTNKI